MTEKSAPVNTPAVKKEANASPEAVMAARLQTVQEMGMLNGKMQRGFDRMTVGIAKGGK